MSSDPGVRRPPAEVRASIDARPALCMVHDYPPLTGGGLALSALALGEIFAAEFRVRVLSSRLVDHFADDRGAIELTARSDVAVSSIRSALAEARNADVVMVHWTFSFRRLSTIILVATSRRTTPVVCVVHTGLDHLRYNRLRRLPAAVRRGLVHWLARFALDRCAAVVALSPSQGRTLAAAGVPVTHVLPVPVDCRDGRSDGHDGRGDAATVRRVGYVGELSILKGTDVLIDLLPALLGHVEQVVVVGSGPLARRLSDAVAELSEPGRVTTTGFVAPASMPLVYAELDAVLVLSRTESQCRVALEAMQHGVIVIARGGSAVADLVTDGVTGCIVDPDDHASLLRRLDELATDAALCASLRTTARRHAIDIVRQSRCGWRGLASELSSRSN